MYCDVIAVKLMVLSLLALAHIVGLSNMKIDPAIMMDKRLREKIFFNILRLELRESSQRFYSKNFCRINDRKYCVGRGFYIKILRGDRNRYGV